MTDIVDIILSAFNDRRPLQMISGEQKEKWQAIEMVARRLVHNRHLAMNSPELRLLIDQLESTLIMPANDDQAESQQEQR